MSPSIRIAILAAALLCTRAAAATTAVDVDILAGGHDTCSVVTAAGLFKDAATIVTTHVSIDGEHGVVTSITRRDCVDVAMNRFGDEVVVDFGGWPVNVASDGTITIETRAPASLLAANRIGFAVRSGEMIDAILRTRDGDAIVWPPPLPHHRPGASAAPLRIALDGLLDDWNGVTPIVCGGALASPAMRLLSVSAAMTADQVNFAFVIQANAEAPTANDDAYSAAIGKTLVVDAPGVLRNDAHAVEAMVVVPPQHGKLQLQPDGSFTYESASPGTEWFEYAAVNKAASSNRARVEIEVKPEPPTDVAPFFTTANNATLFVGRAGNVLIRANGNPAPTISISGALPPGLGFSANPDGGGAFIGRNPAIGAGGIYPLTLTATNGSGSVKQKFVLTVFEAPSFITPPETIIYALGRDVQQFVVKAVGFPKPVLAFNRGAWFFSIDNRGDGSALLTFTEMLLSLDHLTAPPASYSLNVTATNSLSSASQTLTVHLKPYFTIALSASDPRFVPPFLSRAHFTACIVDEPCSIKFAAPSGRTPAFSLVGRTSLPSGLSLFDHGDGTAEIAGTANLDPLVTGPTNLSIVATEPSGSAFLTGTDFYLMRKPIFLPPFEQTLIARMQEWSPTNIVLDDGTNGLDGGYACSSADTRGLPFGYSCWVNDGLGWCPVGNEGVVAFTWTLWPMCTFGSSTFNRWQGFYLWNAKPEQYGVYHVTVYARNNVGVSSHVYTITVKGP